MRKRYNALVRRGEDFDAVQGKITSTGAIVHQSIRGIRTFNLDASDTEFAQIQALPEIKAIEEDRVVSAT